MILLHLLLLVVPCRNWLDALKIHLPVVLNLMFYLHLIKLFFFFFLKVPPPPNFPPFPPPAPLPLRRAPPRGGKPPPTKFPPPHVEKKHPRRDRISLGHQSGVPPAT